MLLAKSLPRLEELPRSLSRVAARPLPTQSETVRRFRLLMMSVNLSTGQVRALSGPFGEPKELPDGDYWLKPRVINEGYFSRMMNSQVPIPDWHVGQMVTICEYMAVVRFVQIEQGHPDAQFYARLLKNGPSNLGWFLKKPEIFTWVDRFRKALWQRLELDRSLSPFDEACYAKYTEYLRGLGYEEEPEQLPSRDEGEGDEVSAPAE